MIEYIHTPVVVGQVRYLQVMLPDNFKTVRTLVEVLRLVNENEAEVKLVAGDSTCLSVPVTALMEKFVR